MRKGKLIIKENSINNSFSPSEDDSVKLKFNNDDVEDIKIDDIEEEKVVEKQNNNVNDNRKRKAYEENKKSENFKFEENLIDEIEEKGRKENKREKDVDIRKKSRNRVRNSVKKVNASKNVKEDKKVQPNDENLFKRTIRSAKDTKRIDDGIDIINNHKEKVEIERKKRIGKTYNEVKEEYNEKIKEEKRKKGLFGKFIILSIVILVIILLFLLYEYGPIFGISLDRLSANKENDIDIVTTESDIYINYNEELLVYSNQKISTYDKNAKKTWEYNLDSMFSPSIYTYKKYLILVNNTSGNIYLFENKKEILDLKIDGTIEHVYVDEFGNMAIEYSTSGYKKIVGVYNKNGINLYNAYLENDSIVNLKILENASKLLIFQTSSNSSKIGIKVNLIDGTKNQDNLKQIVKFDNNFIYDLTIQGRNIIIVLDDKLVKLNIDTSEVSDIKNFRDSQLSFISLTDNYFTTIEKDLNEESSNYNINMLRFDNTVISSTSIQNLPNIMQNSGLLNYFVYQNSLSVINKWGIEIKNEKLDITPKNIIIFNGQKAIALVYTNKIRVIKI